MAPRKGNADTQNVTLNRRGLLKAGLAAAGAALLPSSTGAASPNAAPAAGDDYPATIGRVAEELRPRFESGELHGFRDNDENLQDTVWCERHGVPHDPDYRDSLWVLEDVLAKKVLGFVPEYYGHYEEKPARRAAWVLTHSPSTPCVLDDSGETLLGMATHAMAYDVLRIARQRGWYVATADECPSDERLGLKEPGPQKPAPTPEAAPTLAEERMSGLEQTARRLDRGTGELWAAIESTREASMGVDYALAGVPVTGSADAFARAAHELHVASGRLYEAAAHVAEDKAAA
jgi:hypothetical protein